MMIILILAAVCEIALATYCIATKSTQKRSRNLVRIGSLAVFGIFVIVSVIQFSFRWIPLSVVLFIFALISVISLLRNKEDRKVYKARRIIARGIGVWILIFIATIPELIFPQYKEPVVTGQYSVGTMTYTYEDVSRIERFNDKGENRKVNVEFYYPKVNNGTEFPLIVFSHGAFGVRSSNSSTFNELASNGYIVCSLDHPYHSMYTEDDEGNITIVDQGFVKEVIDVNNGVYDEENNFKLTHKWLDIRVKDISFILDTIIKEAKGNQSNPVYSMIDTEKIGLMGHSLGGAAGVQLGRDRKDIKSVINLDASLIGEELELVDKDKYIVNKEPYPIPLLNIYTDTMKEAMKRATEKITDPDVVIPNKLIVENSPEVYEVYFRGTNHMSVTDLPLFSPMLTKMINGSVPNSGTNQEADKYYVIEKMNSIVLEFFNATIKGNGTFRSAGSY